MGVPVGMMSSHTRILHSRGPQAALRENVSSSQSNKNNQISDALPLIDQGHSSELAPDISQVKKVPLNQGQLALPGPMDPTMPAIPPNLMKSDSSKRRIGNGNETV